MWTAKIILTVVLGSMLISLSHGSLSEEMVTASNAFSIDLMKTIFSSEKRQKNTVVSPLSLSTVLSMVQQGSGGNTLKELDQVLHAQPKSTREGFKDLIQELSGDLEDIKLEIANKLYVRTGFDILKSFVNIVKKDFRSDIEDLNFSDAASAADTINSWVSENTHHKIQSLVTKDMITPDTVLMLLNAVYFSGGWDTVFAERNTNMQPFTTLDGNSKDVATMHHYQEILVGGHNSDIGAKYVHLPFSNNQFSMLLIVPDAVDGLKGVLNSLTTQKLVSLIREVDTRYVDLALPKYKFDTTSKLVPTLKKMGVYDLFDISANLTGISLRPLKATEVIQKAEIEVDEKGAKAVAVTAVVIVELESLIILPNTETLDIKADHPFLFFIVDTSNSVPLFSGWVGEP
ncbi:serpin B4-like isoform X1 [Periplaneta americana]|uniref:serpin B4-like isoform X1 n=1 Tax=Periplaneta americana TaxID=6978 RepID=UPI0037E93514